MLPSRGEHTPRTQCVGCFGLVRAPFVSRKGRFVGSRLLLNLRFIVRV